MDAADRPIANPVVVLREEADQWAILFNPDTSDAVGINPVGVETWKLLDGNRDVSSISETVRQNFRNAPDSAADEVGAFLGELAELGFIAVDVSQ